MVTESPLLFSTWVPLVLTVVPLALGVASTLVTVPEPSTVVLEPEVTTESILEPFSVWMETPSASLVTLTCSTLPATARAASEPDTVRSLTTAPLATPSATIRSPAMVRPWRVTSSALMTAELSTSSV